MIILFPPFFLFSCSETPTESWMLNSLNRSFLNIFSLIFYVICLMFWKISLILHPTFLLIFTAFGNINFNFQKFFFVHWLLLFHDTLFWLLKLHPLRFPVSLIVTSEISLWNSWAFGNILWKTLSHMLLINKLSLSTWPVQGAELGAVDITKMDELWSQCSRAQLMQRQIWI